MAETQTSTTTTSTGNTSANTRSAAGKGTAGQNTNGQSMDTKQSMDPKTVKTVRDALAVLNDAAEKGSTEIQDMIRRDYHELGRMMAEIRPTITSAVRDLRDQGYNQINEYRDQAVDYAKERRSDLDRRIHEKPWTYLGYAAVGGFVLGYMKGR